MTFLMIVIEIIVVAVFGLLFFYIKKKIAEERNGE
jgi:hypothetical protein